MAGILDYIQKHGGYLDRNKPFDPQFDEFCSNALASSGKESLDEAFFAITIDGDSGLYSVNSLLEIYGREKTLEILKPYLQTDKAELKK